MLVLLALLVQLILPPGVMPGAGKGAPIVLCTGHGPASVASGPMGDHDRRDGDHHACPFAHHGLVSPTASSPPLGGGVVAYAPAPAPAARSVFPGQGLAAPPPPSHAPPRTRLT